MSFFAPFARPDLRRFFAATLVSSTGTGMAMLAGKLYLWEATGSNRLVGALGAVGFSAGILAMGRLGTYIDRYDRRYVMVAADLYRVVLSAVVPGALAIGEFRPGVLFVVVFLMGFGHTVGFPTLSAMIGERVPIDERPAVNGVFETCNQVGMMGGAALSGWIYSRGGVGLVYCVDLATFLVSAALFASMGPRAAAPGPAGPGHGGGVRAAPPTAVVRATGAARAAAAPAPGRDPVAEFAAGWAYLRGRPALLVYGLGVTLPWVATMSLNVVLPGLVLTRFRGGAPEVGVIDAAYSLGGVVAGVAGGVVLRAVGVPRGLAILSGLGLAGVFGIGLATKISGAILAAAAFGLGNSGFRVIHRTFLQGRVPNRLLGRVLSLYAWAGISAAATSMVATGWVMDAAGEAAGLAVLVVAQGAGMTCLAWLWARGFFGDAREGGEADGADGGADGGGAAGPGGATAPPGPGGAAGPGATAPTG